MAKKYGIKVSKEGKDVSSTDPRDFNINSEYKVLKVVQSGGGTYRATSSSTPLTINHDLGYNPMIMFFKKAVGSDSGKGYITSKLLNIFDYAHISNVSTDKDNIDVYFFVTGAYTDYEYFYYIFHDEGINL